jgi:hypothetical protein
VVPGHQGSSIALITGTKEEMTGRIIGTRTMPVRCNRNKNEDTSLRSCQVLEARNNKLNKNSLCQLLFFPRDHHDK